MIKYCKNYREFCKIKRKYYHRHFSKYWNTWLSYEIKTPEQVERLKHSKLYQTSRNLQFIVNEYERMHDTTCIYDNNTAGIFRGFAITNEDYYYLLETDGVVLYYSCVGSIEQV